MKQITIDQLPEKEKAYWLPVAERFARKYNVSVSDFRCYPKEECIPFNSYDKRRYVFSNFYPCTLTYNNEFFYSAEQLYFYLCTKQNPALQKEILSKRNAAQVKKMHITEDMMDTNVDKLKMMKEALNIKYKQCTEYRQALMMSEDYPLVEFAFWWDLYWGATTNDNSNYYVGVNATGRIQMGIRAENKIVEPLTFD